MHIAEFKEIQLFRRNVEDEVEFVTIMWVCSIQSVKQFAGEDYTAAVVPNRVISNKSVKNLLI